MSRGKSPVVLPQPSRSVLRRSARLISLQNRDGQGKSGKDLVSGSESTRRSRRKLELDVSKKLVYASGGSIEGSSSKKSSGSSSSLEGFPSLRRSLRVSSKECFDASIEKSAQCSSSTKPASTSSFHSKSTNVSSSCALRRSPRFSSGGGSVDRQSSSFGSKSGNSVLSKCSTKSVLSERRKSGDGVRSRDGSRNRVLPKTKQMFSDSDGEEEVSVCLGERKRTRIEKPKKEENGVPKADKGKRIEKEEEEGLKTKNKHDKGWTEELELVLQGAYLTVKPSPNFWKMVSKMVPGKSAQECFDRVNSALITPRQPQPRSRATRTSISTIPQFSLSASKLLKPNSPKNKIRQGRNNLSKKTIRHLLEKQNHIDQGIGFDLFSVLEPSITGNFLSTPVEKGQSLPIIPESPRSVSKDQTALVSPPVLKPVKNKALHEKYIDHLHIREAKRKAESTRLARKENREPIDTQKKDSMKAAKDALFFDVQDAIQKLKGLQAEKSSSSSEFCYDHGESEEEESI